MKKLIQRTVTFIMAMAIVIPLVLACVYAADDNPKTMLALGDSITTGYGLDNYVPGGNPYFCNSYGNLVAAALGLEGGKTYINKAVNGDTSGDLATLLLSLNDEVKSAELIVISIGGNDLLHVLPDLATIVVGKEITSLDDVVDVLTEVTPDRLDEIAEDKEFLAMIAKTYMNFVVNMASIAKYLDTNAPEARVIFLKQYNPMKGVPGFGDFGDFADPFIDPINTTIDTICQTYAFEFIDVPSVINADAANLTHMLKFDIHPNAAGHLEIAKLLAAHLGISLNHSEETTTVPEVTTEPDPETTPEPEVTTVPPPETTPEPVVTTEPVTEPVTEPITEPPVTTEPVTEPPVTTEPVTEPPVTTEPVTEPETTPEVIVTTEPVITTAPAVTTAPVDTTSPETEPEVTTAPETTTSPDASSELIIEKPGCFSAVSSAILVITSVCALIVLKKKNN